MKKTLSTFFIISLFLFVSCDKEDTSKCFDFEIDYSKENDLKNIWNFVGFIDGYSGDEECVENEGFEMNIMFQTDSTFRAKSTCNGLQGSYQILSENEIIFQNVIITQVACADGRREEIEEKYASNLSYPKHFRIEGNKLEITSISGLELVYKLEE